jgi:transcriptional regulator with XRE-family HTH domain
MNGAILTAAIHDFGTAKEIARVVGCSEATAKRYRRGETSPDPVGLARLMARSRSIADAMLRLAGLDDVSMDLEEARLTRELSELKAKRAGVLDAAVDAAARTALRPMAAACVPEVDRAEARVTRALDIAKRYRP